MFIFDNYNYIEISIKNKIKSVENIENGESVESVENFLYYKFF